MYKSGKGVTKNYKTAVQWYQKSANQGYVTAQRELGIMYARGQGVNQNYKTAVKWYRIAAEQGDAISQNN